MKYAIFGTGNFSNQFIELIDEEEVAFYIDNDSNKRLYNNKKVYLPKEADFSKIDFVMILIQAYAEPLTQLLNMGLNREKIVVYKDLAVFLNTNIYVHSSEGSMISGDAWLSKHPEKKVLCVMHDFSLTGVPVAVMNMALLFRELDYTVMVGSLTHKGPMELELHKNSLDYMDSLAVTDKSEIYQNFIDNFDFILFGTIALADYGKYLSSYQKRMVWWINENYPVLYDKFILPQHRDNMIYFLDGKKTAIIFQEYYPERTFDMLYYFLPDDIVEKKNDDKFVFATIGAISKRKAQDILLASINKISNKYDNVEYWIIGSGSELGLDFEKICSDNNNIKYWPEVNQEELRTFFSKIDVLVCPSRDDTAPIVVSQAFQNSIPCILSDAVGQSEYMKNDIAGYVFKNENIEELALCMERVIQLPVEKRENMGKQARSIFEDYFSKEAVKRLVVEKIINSI